MKGIMAKGIAALAFVLLLTQAQAQETKPVLETEMDRVSYSIGVQLAEMLKRQQVEPRVDALVQGIKDVLTTQTLALTEQERQDVMQKFSETMTKKMQAKQQQMMEERTKAAEPNKKKGEAFLAENKAKEGVVALESGLQYKILTEGKGKKPSDNDTVVVNYRGTLINGKEFDKGEKAQFPVGGVVPGFSEALKLMPVGSKWQIFIPSDLAYGENGAGEDIGPNETLIFELELLEIKEAPAGQPGMGMPTE